MVKEFDRWTVCT